MAVDPLTAINVLMGTIIAGGIAVLVVIAVEDYKRRQEYKRQEEAKKVYLKTLIQLCDATINFNKALANAIDQHEYYANKGDELVEKIAKSVSR